MLRARESLESILLAVVMCFSGYQGASAQGVSNPGAEGNSGRLDLKVGYSVLSGTMGDMTWPEIETAASNQAVVLLPVGVLEEHGPHMSCGADIYAAYLHCRLVKQELTKSSTPAIIGPSVYWGINTSTRNFPGSFDMRPATMKALLADILSNLERWGFTEVYYVNCHGEAGHNQVILESAEESRQHLGINARVVLSDGMSRRFGLKGDEEYIVLVDFDPPPGGPDVTVPDFHAGAEETGDMVAFFPDIVNCELARTLRAPVVKEGGYREWGQDARKVTPLGYAGDPAAFQAAWSGKAIQAYCLAVAQAIAKRHKSR